ncbi:MAG: hypothetical protein IPL29_09715 [Propionivibrio sp.]|nr:hypothetical protein [Propionivibrio sp.]
MFRAVQSIWRPIQLVKARQPAVFWTSLGIALVAGQAGILFAFLGAIGRSVTFKDVLISNLSNANFYTFSISLLASAVVPLAVEYVDAEHRKHMVVLTSQKSLASMMAFFLILAAAGLAGIITSVSLAPGSSTLVTAESNSLNGGSWLQLFTYVLSIAVAAYLIAISRIHFNPDDLAEMTRQETQSRAASAHKLTSTTDGEEL